MTTKFIFLLICFDVRHLPHFRHFGSSFCKVSFLFNCSIFIIPFLMIKTKVFIPSSWEIIGPKVSFPSRYTLSFITKRFGSVFPLSHLVIGLGFLSQLIRLWSCLIIGLLSMRSLSLLIPN